MEGLKPNNAKFCLVYTLSTPWENYHREQFIKCIADQIKLHNGYILCVEPTVLSLFNFVKYPERIVKWIKGRYKFRNVYENIYAVSAFTLEHILLSVRFGILDLINRKLLNKQIWKLVKKIDKDIRKLILVLHRPEMKFLMGHINESGAVFDCCDDYTLTSNMSTLKVIGNRKREKELSEKCSFVIASSLKLLRRNKEYNQNTYLIENGYNFEKFTTASDFNVDFVKKIKRPIAGYIGNVRDWIDFELLEYLFEKHHDVSFVFFGAVNKNSKRTFNKLLSKFDNVFTTGRIPYSSYQYYFNYIDVGIIPFQVNEFMESVNPNKFYELMGAGIPVVATRMGDLNEMYFEIAKVGRTKEEFSKHLEKIVKMSPSEQRMLKSIILKIAENHTWKQKASYFLELLNQHILDKPIFSVNT